jgi:hypothetical protein
MQVTELLLGELSSAGVEPAQGHRLYRQLQAFTVGAATMAAARPPPDELRQRAAEIAGFAERFPLLESALPQVADASPDDDFEQGLALLIASLRRQIGPS